LENAKVVREHLEAIAAVLWRCTVIGFALLAFWFCLYLLAGAWMYDVHHGLMGIGRAGFVRMHYWGMALLKMAVFLFFLTPYLAIRWYLAKRD